MYKTLTIILLAVLLCSAAYPLVVARRAELG
mgnify:CR=1 FL=1